MSRLWILAAIVLSLLATPTMAVDLTGTVLDASGNELEGASVFISTARPRVGVSIFCPSCYDDCKKSATTDRNGNFTIEALDPDLIFRVLVTAEGHRSKIVTEIDPAGDTPIVELEPLPVDLPPEYQLRGRVVGADGRPLASAVIDPFGCKKADRRWWGSLQGVDGTAVSNRSGEFIITADSPAEGYDLEIRAPGHAPKAFELVSTGEALQELKLDEGGYVRGRILKEGQPVAGINVGLVQCDRGAGTFLGTNVIGTDANGEFLFSNISAGQDPEELGERARSNAIAFGDTPGEDYYIYTIMKDSQAAGSIPLQRVTVAENGKTVELGDLAMRPTCTLSGRIVLTDGTKLAKPTQLLLSRSGAWDSQTQLVAGEGAFRFENVPIEEPMTFHVRVPGYHLAGDLNAFQQIRENGIALFVEESRDDIVIHFEPAGMGN